MRRQAFALVTLAAFALAPTGAAQDDEEDYEEETFWGEYAAATLNKWKIGANGLITWPADPVAGAVDPPRALEEAGWAQRPLGVGAGLLMMAYRLGGAGFDLALAPLPLFPPASPPARFKLIRGFEHPDE